MERNTSKQANRGMGGDGKIRVFNEKVAGKTPQIINSNRVFSYKPSILGYHYFWKHPKNVSTNRLNGELNCMFVLFVTCCDTS